jgi:threonine/homoserine/homoserine lactone efflux protein
LSDIHHYGLFVLAAIVLILTPGQDTLYILGRSLSGGLRSGVASALGITAGSIVHTVAAAAGLSLLLRAFPPAFAVVKLCGAAYLIYLGARLLLMRNAVHDLTMQSPPSSARRAFMQAALTNRLNPKVALFFLAFLPQFIDPQGESKSLAFLTLRATFVSMGGIWCLVLACAAARLRTFLVRNAILRRRIDRGVGALFMLLGARLAWGR